MKKGIILIFIFLLFASFVVGQNAPGIDEAPLVGDIQNIQDNIQDGNYNQSADDYLKQEWRKILSRNEFGSNILKISDFFKNFNPFFKAVLGVEYSLSWSFTFAVLIWLFLFLFLYPMTSQVFGKLSFGILSAAVIASLIGLAGVIRMAVNVLNKVIETFWIAVVAFLIFVVIALVLERLGKKFGKNIEAAKEKAAKQQTEKDRIILHTDAEISKENLEGYKDGGGI